MRGGELSIYAALLVLGAGLAFSSWKGDEPVSKESVAIFDAGSGGLKEVAWDAERNVATLEVEGKGEHAGVWITAGRKARIVPEAPEVPEVVATDDDDSAGAVEVVEVEPATPEPVQYGEAVVTSFPGSSQAVTLVERLASLTALRQFDGLNDEELAGMGLDEPEGTMTLKSASKSLTLEIGAKSYGSSDTYAREPGSTTAYLLSSKDLGSLRSASSSLRDRDLLGFEPTDAATVEIRAPNAAPVPARHLGRHDKDNSFWAAPDSEERDAVLDGFMKALLLVKASTYLAPADMPTDADLQPVVAVAFAGDDGALGQLEVASRLDVERSKADDPVFEYYARSHRTRGGWAKVSRTTVEEVTDALAGLLGR